jgi:hypothetical protein
MATVKKKAVAKKAEVLKLGPKGKEAFTTIISTMAKFRTDERKRMVGYVATWVKTKGKSPAAAKHA